MHHNFLPICTIHSILTRLHWPILHDISRHGQHTMTSNPRFIHMTIPHSRVCMYACCGGGKYAESICSCDVAVACRISTTNYILFDLGPISVFPVIPTSKRHENNSRSSTLFNPAGVVSRAARNGPLTRYVKLWIVHAPGILGTFSPPLTSKETAG